MKLIALFLFTCRIIELTKSTATYKEKESNLLIYHIMYNPFEEPNCLVYDYIPSSKKYNFFSKVHLG